MSNEYDDTNRGAMFANDKQGNDKRPDRKGSLNVEGVDYWISGWIKTSKQGQKYMSLSVERKEQQGGKKQPAKSSQAHNGSWDDFDGKEDDNEEIPF